MSISDEFYVVDSKALPLISLNLSLELGLIKITYYDIEKQPEMGLDLQTFLAKNKDLFKVFVCCQELVVCILKIMLSLLFVPHAECLLVCKKGLKKNLIQWRPSKLLLGLQNQQIGLIHLYV